MRRIRYQRLFSLAVLGGLIVSFQNCAPPAGNTLCPAGQVCENSHSSSQGGNSNGNRPNIPNQNNNGQGSGESNNSGWGGSGGSSSGGTGGWGTGGGGGGGTGGWGTEPGGPENPPPGGGGDTTFRFHKNLTGPVVTVDEGADLLLEIGVAGGTPPYRYQWYKDSVAIPTLYEFYQRYSTRADRFTKQGVYHVVVTDNQSRRLVSNSVRVTITIPLVGCGAGTYTALEGDPLMRFVPPDQREHVQPLSTLYENVRGKYLIPTSHPDLVAFQGNWEYYGFMRFNVAQADFGNRMRLNCNQHIPRINPLPHNWNCMYGSRDDCTPKTYTGHIEFTCENKKWRMLENSCREYVPPTTEHHGGGGW